jgi:hypothetical protein
MTHHKATAEQWAQIEQYADCDCSTECCLLELRDRIAALDAHLCVGPSEETDDIDNDLITRARAALAQPEPVGPTDEELWLTADDEFRAYVYSPDAIRFARAVLTRWGRPVITPIPVSERLPGPEDCDAEGGAV